MIEKLNRAFAPAHLDVADESRMHAGHAGHRPGGETHYRVHIVSAAFEGKSRIERHRMVNQALADELAGGIHALAIHASAPGEGGGDDDPKRFRNSSPPPSGASERRCSPGRSRT